MTQPSNSNSGVAAGDILNSLLGLDEGSEIAQLRTRRPEATGHMQLSYQALFVDPPATSVTRVERFAIALRVAKLHDEHVFVEHYSVLLRGESSGSAQLVSDVLAGPSSTGLTARLRAILTHADLLVIRPGAAQAEDLKTLQLAGLSIPEIVTVSQIISFVSFHIRVYVALTLVRGDDRVAPSTTIGPKDAPNSGFTQERLGWAPWLPPFEVADATDEQRAVLPGQRLNNPYFRLLAFDPVVLGERTATDNGIFYTTEGLPRAERELSAAVTSRVNGCVYCASVHSRLAAQLSKRTEDVQRLLDEGITARQDDRWQAITDLAAALAVTPPTATQKHIARLRGLGLENLDLLDAMQATAFFSWANRLMLTLGEPLPPEGSADEPK